MQRVLEAASRERLVPFLGAGFSAAVANAPSWSGLLTHAIDYVQKNQADFVEPTSDVDLVIDAAQASGKAGDLIGAFEKIQALLESNQPHYAAFLEQACSDLPIADPSLLNALAALEPRVVVTTNYDTIVEDNLRASGVLSSATWKEPEHALGIVRAGEGVVHLHGRYDAPDSVVLSRSDYDAIAADSGEILAHLSSSIFFSGVLLFIGTSLDGVTDPHLGKILEVFGQMAARDPAGTSHVMLVRGVLPAKERVRLRALGIEPVSFGDSYSDLPVFLSKLAKDYRAKVDAEPLRDFAAKLRAATAESEAVVEAGRFLEKEVFAGRSVRIGFVEPDPNNSLLLRPQHVHAASSSGNSFLYPATLAAWSLVSGRIVSFPADLDAPCDFGWIGKLGKLDRVDADFERLPTAAEIDDAYRKYVDLAAVRDKVRARSLRLRDLFQDWDSDQPTSAYRQFISVPVPTIHRAASGRSPGEIGVFNIDSAESLALLTPSVEAKLGLATELLHEAVLRIRS